MLEHLDAAIRELIEAKRLAKLFGWPESVINKIDLVRRGAIHYRKQIAEEMSHDERRKHAEVTSVVQ